MGHLFTAAAERALTTASQWSSRSDSDTLELPELLLGLLAESECRAALMLASRGIVAADIERQWPTIASRPGGTLSERRFSEEVIHSFAAAESQLAEFPRPLALATEFILLGIVAEGGPVGEWLSARGLGLVALEAEIHALYDHKPGPLALETDELSLSLDESERDEIAEVTAEPTVNEDDPQQSLRFAVLENRAGASSAVWRILDAEANRAGEALRVVEDYVRFALDDRHLAVLVKEMRHELAAAVSLLAPELRHSARDTQADVGTTISTAAEWRRGTAAEVATANLRRVSESLRSLEEYSKVVEPAASARLEALRYRSYTLESAIQLTRTSCERLATARLYVLLDGRESEAAFLRLATSLVEAGVHILQLRDKRLADRELLARARLLRSCTRDTETLFVMNDRADLATLSDADGVHVGQEELSVKDARAIVGPARLVGVSTHSIEQARSAVLDGANYIGVGPTFRSSTKSFDSFTGVALLRAVAGEIRLPTFAIGGITSENITEVLATHVARVAIGAAVTEAADPAGVARTLIAQCESVRLDRAADR